MSTHWGLYCADHDEDDGIDLNHMDDELRQLWALRADLPRFLELAELTEADIPHYPMGGYASIRFAVKHTDCNVLLADEYGNRKSLVDTEPCPHIFKITWPQGNGAGGRSGREEGVLQCQLGTHSKGKHRFKGYRLLVEWD